MTGHFRKFGSSSLLALFGIFALILTVGGAACWQLGQQRFEQEKEQGELLAYQTSLATSLWLDNQVAIANGMAAAPLIRMVCARPADADLRANAAAYLARIQTGHPEFTQISLISLARDSVVVTGPDGLPLTIAPGHSFVDSVGGQNLNSGGPDADQVKAVRNGALSFIGVAKTAPLSGQPPMLLVAVPVNSEQGETIGVLTFGVQLKYFSSFFSDRIKAGSTGKLEILDGQGRYVSHSDRALLFDAQTTRATKPILDILRRGETQFTLIEEGRVRLYYAAMIKTSHVMDTPWWVLYRRDQAEIYATLAPPLVGLGVLCAVVFGLLALLTFRANIAMARSQKDKKLVRQMEAYRLYTRTIPFGIALVDRQGCFADINPAAASLLNYTEQELVGCSLATLGGTGKGFTWLKLKETMPDTGESATSRNIPLLLRDGTVAVFDMTMSPLEMPDKEQYLVLTFSPVPVTRDLEERMRAVYSTSFDYYLTFDERHTMLDCTDTCVTLFKAKSKDDLITNFIRFSPPAQPDGRPSDRGVHAVIDKALLEGFHRLEWMHQTSDGEQLPCELSLVRFTHRGRPAVTACLRDLRVQKSHEAALAREQGILRAVIDNIQSIIFLRDAEGRYTIVNQRFTDVVGPKPELLLGKTDLETLPLEQAASRGVTDRAAREASGPYYFEEVLTLPDGTLRDYLMCKEAVHTAEGEFDGILGMGVDVTRLKEAERQISIAKAMAEDASQAKSDFLARMSHEIRTPMNAILGMSYLCLRLEMPAAQRNYLTKIRDAADHLMEVLNSILDFSKIESGKMDVEEIPFALDDILAQVHNLFTERAALAGLVLEVSADNNVPRHLVGDPLHLKQILINLGANALKFTKQGSVRFHVSVENMLEDRVRLRFTVSDTGIGMTPEQMGRLFEPFTQANGSMTRLYGGTGLGLAICKSLLDLLDGKIRVTSKPDEGTSFLVSLWLRLAAEPDAEPDADTVMTPQAFGLPASGGMSSAPAPSTVPLGGWTAKNITLENALSGSTPEPSPVAGSEWTAPPCSVLLAEDDPINQEIALELLKLSGITPDVAANGQEAVDAFHAALITGKPYDLVLMDLQMPIMDGLEATTRMRAEEKSNPACRPALIIAMTAHAIMAERQHCLDIGMNDHLSKPVNPDKLRAMLQKWLEGDEGGQ